MADEQLEDLKQFIEVTVSQSEARIKDELASKSALKSLDSKLGSQGKKLDAGFAGVGEAITNLSDHIDERLNDHEVRITKLEQAA